MTLALIEKGFVLEVSWPSKKKTQLSSQYIPAQFPQVNWRILNVQIHTKNSIPLPPLKHAGAPWPHGGVHWSTWWALGMACHDAIAPWKILTAPKAKILDGFSDGFLDAWFSTWVDCLFGEAFVNFPGMLPQKKMVGVDPLPKVNDSPSRHVAKIITKTCHHQKCATRILKVLGE